MSVYTDISNNRDIKYYQLYIIFNLQGGEGLNP